MEEELLANKRETDLILLKGEGVRSEIECARPYPKAVRFKRDAEDDDEEDDEEAHVFTTIVTSACMNNKTKTKCLLIGE